MAFYVLSPIWSFLEVIFLPMSGDEIGSSASWFSTVMPLTSDIVLAAFTTESFFTAFKV